MFLKYILAFTPWQDNTCATWSIVASCPFFFWRYHYFNRTIFSAVYLSKILFDTTRPATIIPTTCVLQLGLLPTLLTVPQTVSLLSQLFPHFTNFHTHPHNSTHYHSMVLQLPGIPLFFIVVHPFSFLTSCNSPNKTHPNVLLTAFQ